MDTKQNIRASFKKVKDDMKAVKELLSQWFYFFNNKQTKMEVRMEELEKRLEKLEADKIRGMVYDKVSY